MTEVAPNDVRWMAKTLTDLERKVDRNIGGKPGLHASSIEGGSIDEYDTTGKLVSQIGEQYDGTHAAASLSGPNPPMPTLPQVSAVAGVVEFRWNGKFEADIVSPMDFRHVAGYVVHVGDPIDLADQAGVLTGELGDAKQIQVDGPGVYDVYLVAWSLSGKHSDYAGPVAVLVPDAADAEALQLEIDAAQERIDAAAADLAATKIELDTRLDTAESNLAASSARLDTAEGDISTLTGTTLPALEGDLTDARSRLTTAETNITAAQTGLTTAQGQLDTLTGTTLPGLDSDLAAAKGRLDMAETNITAAQTAINTTLPGAIENAQDAADMALLIAPVSTAAPTTADGAGRPVNAIWTRIDGSGNAVAYWRWNGSAWSTLALSQTVIPNLAASKITSGTIAAARIDTAALAVAIANIIELNANRITSGQITSAQIDTTNLAASIASIISLNADRITAGTIATARLDVANLAVQLASIISLNANRITSGTIATARLDVNDLAANIATVISLNASRITSGTIATARLNAAEIAAATATIQTMDVKNLFATTGTLSEAVITRLFTDIFATNKLSANQVLIGSGVNLVPNGGGELGSTAGWPAPLIYDAVDKPAGVIGAFRTVAGQSTVTNSSPLFPVTAGQEYLFEVWVKADKPDSRIYIEYRDQTNAQNVAFTDALDEDGNPLPNGNGATYFAGNAIVPTTWTKWTMVGVPGPTVERIRVSGLYFNHPNGTERSAVVSVAGFSVRPRVGTSLVATGTIIAPHIVASEEMSAKLGEFLRVSAQMIEVGALDGQVITGAIIQSPGEGAGYQLTEGGYTSRDADGNVTVRLPSDGSSPQFRGDIEARSLTASGRVSMQATGNEITSGAELVLESGVTAPLSPPTVGVTYDRMELPYTGELNGINTAGLARANGLWWRASRGETSLLLHSVNDAGVITATYPTGLLGSNGMTAIGNEIFILGRWDGASEARHVAVYSALTGAYIRRWVYAAYGTGSYQPGIGVSSGSIVIAQCWADGKLSWRGYNPSTGTQLGASVDTGAILRQNITGIYGGAADYGTSYVTVVREDGVTNVFTSAGVNVTGGGWNSAGQASVVGFVWDSGSFHHLTDQGVLVTYSGFQNPDGDTDDWWVCTDWRGDGGSRTTMGQPQRFQFMRRSELQVSAGTPPVGATGMVVYLARKTTTPGRTDFHALGTYSGGTARIDVPTNWATGSNPLSTNTFNTSTPGMIRSRSTNFEVKGDGTGHWGPFTFNADGSMTSAAVPAWVPITSFKNGCTVGDFGFVPAYRSWPDGKVELRGVVKGNLDVIKEIFSLPSAARSAQPVNLTAATNGGGTAPAVMRVEIGSLATPDSLSVVPQGVTRVWVSLDGLYYYQV